MTAGNPDDRLCRKGCGHSTWMHGVTKALVVTCWVEGCDCSGAWAEYNDDATNHKST